MSSVSHLLSMPVGRQGAVSDVIGHALPFSSRCIKGIFCGFGRAVSCESAPRVAGAGEVPLLPFGERAR